MSIIELTLQILVLAFVDWVSYDFLKSNIEEKSGQTTPLSQTSNVVNGIPKSGSILNLLCTLHIAFGPGESVLEEY